MTIVNDVVDTLGIEVDSLVLGTSYVSRDLIRTLYIGIEKKYYRKNACPQGLSVQNALKKQRI